MVEWHCFATGAQHGVIVGACRARMDNGLGNPPEFLAETQHIWRHMRKGIEPPAPQADASWLPRPGPGLNLVDGDGDNEQPHAQQRMHVQKIITSRVGRD